MPKVFADSSSKQFYLLPDDADLPSGPLVLRSLTGDRLEVDAEAAEAYAISEDEAKERVKQQLAEVAQRATGILASLGTLLRGAAEGLPTGPKPQEASVAEALGVTPEQLRDDPKAVLAGLKRVGAGLVESLKDALASDPASEEVTRQRIEALAGVVGADPKDLDDLRNKLKAQLMDPELEQRIKQATDDLRTSTDDLEN